VPLIYDLNIVKNKARKKGIQNFLDTLVKVHNERMRQIRRHWEDAMILILYRTHVNLRDKNYSVKTYPF
jgi:hypothetical protein